MQNQDSAQAKHLRQRGTQDGGERCSSTSDGLEDPGPPRTHGDGDPPRDQL